MHLRHLLLHPREQSGTQIEADARVVVHDPGDSAGAVQHSGRGVRRVALGADPLAPIVLSGCGVLNLDRCEPRIFAWRLIEVAVNTNKLFHMFPRFKNAYTIASPAE